jgi:GxxExxY protein
MALGPGLLESVYEVLLAHRLRQAGLQVQRQVRIPIEFDGIQFDEGFRADIIVNGKVILELKSVESIHPAHKKQVLTYLKLTGLKLGYLLNFGAPVMKDGIYRIINGTIA